MKATEKSKKLYNIWTMQPQPLTRITEKRSTKKHHDYSLFKLNSGLQYLHAIPQKTLLERRLATEMSTKHTELLTEKFQEENPSTS